jgi:hypothetical protein
MVTITVRTHLLSFARLLISKETTTRFRILLHLRAQFSTCSATLVTVLAHHMLSKRCRHLVWAALRRNVVSLDRRCGTAIGWEAMCVNARGYHGHCVVCADC